MRPSAQKRLGLLSLAPTMLFLAVVFVYPLLQIFRLSLIDTGGDPSLLHYIRLFESSLYVRVVAGTFTIAGWTTFYCVLIGYPIAYALATTSESRRYSLALWVLIPFWTSFLVRTFAWMILLGQRGVINSTLIELGIIDTPVRLLHNQIGVLVGMVHALLPIAVLTMLAVMQAINPRLTQAAATLGAGRAQSFWRIYFPMSLPGLAAAVLLIFVTSIGFFITPTLLGSPREMMIAQVIIIQVEEMLDWGFAGALAVFLLALTMVVFFLFDRILGVGALTGDRAVAAVPGRRTGGLTAGLRRLGERSAWAVGSVGGWIERLFTRNDPSAFSKPQTGRRVVLWTFVGLALCFLVLPAFFVIPISFSESPFFEWPPRGFTLRWYEEYFSSPVWRVATIRSLAVGLLVATLSLLLGVPAAFALSRGHVPGRSALLGFLMLPMVMPHIIVAVALFYFFSGIGLVGTTAGLVLGHTIFSLPYVIVTLIAVLRNYDHRLDEAAWTLGATRFAAFRAVTLPLLKAGLITSFLFAFVKSFDELTVALFISGGFATTLPRQMWADALLKASPALAAVSTIVLLIVMTVMLAAEFMRRRNRV